MTKEAGTPDFRLPTEEELRQIEQTSRLKEIERQIVMLGSTFAQEFFQTREEYLASLPKEFGPKTTISPDSPLFAFSIIDPRIRLERILELTEATANINALGTQDVEGLKVPNAVYVIRTVVESCSFDDALLLAQNQNPSFRGTAAKEGALFAFFNNDLLDESPIFLPGSRTEGIYMPFIRKIKGKVEMGNDLPINRAGQGKLKFLLAAR